jgi:hypothetical protein
MPNEWNSFGQSSAAVDFGWTKFDDLDKKLCISAQLKANKTVSISFKALLLEYKTHVRLNEILEMTVNSKFESTATIYRYLLMTMQTENHDKGRFEIIIDFHI